MYDPTPKRSVKTGKAKEIKIQQSKPGSWPTAPSLRPNTESLYFGMLANDPEAAAILEAWRFQPNQGTRIVRLSQLKDGSDVGLGDAGKQRIADYYSTLTFAAIGRNSLGAIEDEDLIAELDEEESENTMLELSETTMMSNLADAVEEENGITLDLNEKDGFIVCQQDFKEQKDRTPFKILASLRGISKGQRKNIVQLILDRSMLQPHRSPEQHKAALAGTLHDYATYACTVEYKQKSFRDNGTELEVAHSFAMHVMGKINEGKYQPIKPFHRWVKTCFRRFADTALNNLSRENILFEPLTFTVTNSSGEQEEVSHSDLASLRDWKADEKRSSRIAKALKGLNKIDRSYADLLFKGFNQKQAAAQMGESAVTSRLREERIRAAIGGVLVNIQACADEEYEGEFVGDIFGCADRLSDVVRRRGKAWTADELGELLSLSRKHLYKLAKTQRMPSYRLGGAVRFDPEAVANWLEDRSVA